MWSNAAVKSTNSKYSGCVLRLDIWWILLTVKIPSVVPLFFLNPFCSSVNCASYHGLIRSNMMLMINLHTVDPMLIPRYLVGSDFGPFPFQSVFSFEFPHAVGRSEFDQRFSASLCMTWSMIGYSHFLRISGSMSLLALPDFSWWRCFWISSIDRILVSMGKLLEMFRKLSRKSGALVESCSGMILLVRSGLKWFWKCFSNFSGGHFPVVLFRVVSWLLALEKSLSSSLLMANWLIFSASDL